MDGAILLAVRDLCLRLGGAPILDRVSFDVHDRVRAGLCTGQVVAILGPSGVGKTRLLRIIAALDAADSGTVRGIEGATLSAGDVGVVFQDYPLLRHRRLRKNLEVAGLANGLSRAAAQKRAGELLDKFRLADRGGHFPAQLSGGQRQRAAIAQQLVLPKHLLLLDEPFSGLDPAALDEVMHFVVEVANLDETNTILVVTHDIRAAMAVCDTVFMLGRDRAADGRLLPGARIQATYDLVERGLAWHSEVTEMPAFSLLEKEIKARFKQL